jgi:hypothetical protein
MRNRSKASSLFCRQEVARRYHSRFTGLAIGPRYNHDYPAFRVKRSQLFARFDPHGKVCLIYVLHHSLDASAYR